MGITTLLATPTSRITAEIHIVEDIYKNFYTTKDYTNVGCHLRWGTIISRKKKNRYK